MGLVDRRGHREDKAVAPLQIRSFGGEHSPGFMQRLVRNLAVPVNALLQPRHMIRIGVKAQRIKPCACQGQCQRQAHIAKPQYRNLPGLRRRCHALT